MSFHVWNFPTFQGQSTYKKNFSSNLSAALFT